MRRSSLEATLAILILLAMLGVGGGSLYLVSTRTPHTTPEAVASSIAAPVGATDAATVGALQRDARALVVRDNLPALSVAVMRDGHIVWAEAFGLADMDARRAATPETLFRIGALSQLLTSAAVGVLHERGMLDLERPFQDYVPAYPEKAWPISTRQLMAHTSGLRNRNMPPRHCATVDDAVPVWAGDAPAGPSGMAYRYSPYNWVLVSAVVEHAAGEPFAAFVTREVIGATGLRHTVADQGDTMPGRAALYFPRIDQKTQWGHQEAPGADYSCWSGAGMFDSTPSDLVQFGDAMMRPGLLQADTLAVLYAPQTLDTGETTGRGLGWRVDQVPIAGTATRLISQEGSPMGGTATLQAAPDLGIVVALTSNVSFARGLAPFGLKVLEAFAQPRPAAVR